MPDTLPPTPRLLTFEEQDTITRRYAATLPRRCSGGTPHRAAQHSFAPIISAPAFDKFASR
jgi:hypothetical protein